MSQQQGQLLEAKTSWFHVFRSMIDCGDCAKMGEAAVMLYLVIKSYTNWSTGKSWPEHKVLMEKTGYSVAKVNRCLRVLEENGYVTRQKVGRTNQYILREKFDITDGDGRPCATATFDYLPSIVTDAQAELKNFLLSGGDADGLKYVKIDTLNITLNIQNNNESSEITQNNYNFNTSEIQDPKLRQQLERIIKKRAEQRAGGGQPSNTDHR